MSLEKEIEIFESLLSSISEGEVTRDPDGDYVLNYGGACFYARVIGEVHPVVQVFSVASSNLPAIPDLLAFLNEVNRDNAFVRTFHVADQVLVEVDIYISELSPARFHSACRHIAEISDRISGSLSDIFDASPRWQLGKKKDYAFGFAM